MIPFGVDLFSNRGMRSCRSIFNLLFLYMHCGRNKGKLQINTVPFTYYFKEINYKNRLKNISEDRPYVTVPNNTTDTKWTHYDNYNGKDMGGRIFHFMMNDNETYKYK